MFVARDFTFLFVPLEPPLLLYSFMFSSYWSKFEFVEMIFCVFDECGWNRRIKGDFIFVDADVICAAAEFFDTAAAAASILLLFKFLFTKLSNSLVDLLFNLDFLLNFCTLCFCASFVEDGIDATVGSISYLDSTIFIVLLVLAFKSLFEEEDEME